MALSERVLYIFLDESGNFDFSLNGTKYFIITAVTKERPFYAFKELTEMKYDLIESGFGIEYFHATEDSRKTRNEVLQIITRHLNGISIDSIIAEKSRTAVALRSEDRFYPELLGVLLQKIIERQNLSIFREVIIFTDTIPINRKREMIAKSIKTTLSEKLPSGIQYRIYHHASKSNVDLQIADYCNWAIYRKWASGDDRSYGLIKDAIQSELEIYREDGISR